MIVSKSHKKISIIVIVLLTIFFNISQINVKSENLPIVTETFFETDSGFDATMETDSKNNKNNTYYIDQNKTIIETLLEDENLNDYDIQIFVENKDNDNQTNKNFFNNLETEISRNPNIIETIIEDEGIIVSSGNDAGSFQEEIGNDDIKKDAEIEIIETIIEDEGIIISNGNDAGSFQEEETKIIETIIEDEEIIISDINELNNLNSESISFLEYSNININDQNIPTQIQTDVDHNIRELKILENQIIQNDDIGITIEISKNTSIIAPISSKTNNEESNNEEDETDQIFYENPLDEIMEDEMVEVFDKDEQNKIDIDIEVVNEFIETEIEQDIEESSQQKLDLQKQRQVNQINGNRQENPFIGKAKIKSSNFVLQNHEQIENTHTHKSLFIENDTNKNLRAENTEQKTFDFGLLDQHVVFSKSVKITIDVPESQKNKKIQLLVKHHGETEFGNKGISTDPSSQCLNNGEASIPNSETEAIDGKAIFYTCGASVFAIDYVPSIRYPNGQVKAMATQGQDYIIIGGSFTQMGELDYPYIAKIDMYAQLDRNFRININGDVEAIAVQSDEKILIGGGFSTISGNVRNYFARLNRDGSLDQNFNPIVNNTVFAIEVQSDGKILIGGDFTSVNGQTCNRIARLNTDGSLDTTFNQSINNSVYKIVVQNDGKILVGGGFATVGGVSKRGLVRLNVDGSIDSSLNIIMNSATQAIVIQDDGKILIGGNFTTINTVARNNVARINPDGSLDLGFDPNAAGKVNTIALFDNGDIVLGGVFTKVGGINSAYLAKVDTDGNVISTLPLNAIVNAAIQKNDILIIGGRFTSYNSLVIPYLAFFEDTSFYSPYAPRPNGIVHSLAVQADGKIIIGGAFGRIGSSVRNRIARLNIDGSLDLSFENINVNNTIQNIAIQSDGKIVIAGAFTTIDSVTYNRIARLNIDGSVDTSFNASANVTIDAIAIQSDGKILIGGNFTNVNGQAINRIARLNTDGSLDTSFNPNANGRIYTINIQKNGQILVGGGFTAIGGNNTYRRIVRLNTDGSLDTSFFVPLTNGNVYEIILLEDNSMLIGGTFTETAGNAMIKLHSDGSFDTSVYFDFNNRVNTIRVIDNETIIAGGYFTGFAGQDASLITKLNMLGEKDPQFNPVIEGQNQPYVLDLELDGKGNIVFGGSFTLVNGYDKTPYLAWIGLGLPPEPEGSALWLKSKDGTNCNTNGCNINSRIDQSENGRNASIQLATGGQVIYNTQEQINFNPTIHLKNARLVFENPTNLSNFSAFYIIRARNQSPAVVLLEDEISSMRFSQTYDTQKYGYSLSGFSNAITNIPSQWNTWHVLNIFSASMPNMTFCVQTPENVFSEMNSFETNPNIGIKYFSSIDSDHLGDFDIAEILVFNGQPSDQARKIFMTYFSIKYGFMLAQSDGKYDYWLNNDLIVWSEFYGSGYNSQIAGIARNDDYGLYQRKSQTISNAGDIIVEKNGELDNLSSLVWGNNGDDMSQRRSIGIDTGIVDARIAREWLFQNLNNVDSVKIRIPKSALPNQNNLDGQDVIMLIKEDNNFNTGATTITGILINNFYEFNTEINHLDHITFAIVQKTMISDNICIEGPIFFDAGNIASSNHSNTMQSSSDHFFVKDLLGTLSGYYTTISIGDLHGPNGKIISNNNIEWKAENIILISGIWNSGVVLGSGMNDYHLANGTDILIKREPGINQNILGIYATKLNIKLTVPAYTSHGIYTGIITYTLYQN